MIEYRNPNSIKSAKGLFVPYRFLSQLQIGFDRWYVYNNGDSYQ